MDETPWLDTDELDVWKALAAVLFLLPAALESQLQHDEGLAVADYMVLVMLSERSDRCMRMSELAEAASTSQSRLSRIVARLEVSGFVRRDMAPDDRRAVLATLTDDGLRKLEQAAPGHVRAVRALVFDRLDADQMHSLGEITGALLTAPSQASVVGVPCDDAS